MPNPERRKPNPQLRSSAIKKARKSIVSEILGAVMAAAIFAASMWSSVLGMSEGPEPGSIVSFTLAGVQHDGR